MSDQYSNWYGVKLLYLFQVTGEPVKELLDNDYIDNYTAFEESVVIVNADSFDDAYAKAEMLAKGNEDSYQNLYEQQVDRRFYDFVDCYLIDAESNTSLVDGIEVYSNIVQGVNGLTPQEFMEKHFPIDSSIKTMMLNKDLPLS